MNLVDRSCTPMVSKPALWKQRQSFCFLRPKSAGWVLLWCSSVRLRDSVAGAKLEQLCQEQNVLPLPITSYPPGCLAHGLCIMYVLAPYTSNANPLAVCSLPNSGRGESLRATPVWWYADTHCVLHTSATLQGIFQAAVMLFHRYKGRLISAMWEMYHF